MSTQIWEVTMHPLALEVASLFKVLMCCSHWARSFITCVGPSPAITLNTNMVAVRLLSSFSHMDWAAAGWLIKNSFSVSWKSVKREIGNCSPRASSQARKSTTQQLPSMTRRLLGSSLHTFSMARCDEGLAGSKSASNSQLVWELSARMPPLRGVIPKSATTSELGARLLELFTVEFFALRIGSSMAASDTVKPSGGVHFFGPQWQMTCSAQLDIEISMLSVSKTIEILGKAMKSSTCVSPEAQSSTTSEGRRLLEGPDWAVTCWANGH
mmetsp:Transcript_51706/g.93169  ORF Transcript_51706/g.93169 Transcript_51706/m.93169 type:complete len:269 (-) Transcript_51706:2171-2977(-)